MFGPYRLERLLGQGGMGEVYRAFDTVRGRVVAVKRLPSALAGNQEFQARFRKECALAARLHEPHIIPIHDFGEIDGRLFLDMRLVEGTDLAALLAADGPLEPRRAVHIVAQVAAALDVAHAQGLVHRDIKPGNVLVTPGRTSDDDFVYVADFGLARAVSTASTRLTATGTTIGSLDYLAPERFGTGQGDHRADIYALGCVLFEALTGRPPFVVEGVPAMMHAHMHTPPPRPSQERPGVPVALDAVVARAMAKDPAERYPSAGELAAAARAAVLRGADDTAAPTVGHGHGPPPAAPTAVHQRGPGPVPPFVPGGGPGPPPLPPPGHGQQGFRVAAHAPPRAYAGPPPPPPQQGRRRVPPWLIATAVAAVVVLLGAGAFLVWTSGQASAEVLREPVRSPGDNPFMPAVGQDQPDVPPPPNAGGVFDGATTGLYGGTRDNASCDPAAMLAFLEANPDKAAAWAEAQGITTAQIPAFVDRLTPVILRSDTAVTNHGFRNGSANPFQAVLQAGTAVLVDEYGVPRVKCACGNPLLPPRRYAEPTYTGPTWPGFAPVNVTVIQSTTIVIIDFTLVDPSTGEAFTRPAGTTGDEDRNAQGASTPTPTPSPTAGPTAVASGTPLYQVPATADTLGPSGVRADPALTGVPGAGNTSLWSGCQGSPGTTTFQLGGRFTTVAGRLTLIDSAPPDIVVEVGAAVDDGLTLPYATLRPGQVTDFSVPVSGAQQLTMDVNVVGGTCGSSPVGWVVMMDGVASG
jgi:hypothetical protein